jgi:apolipoprotein N-acyltransferase
MTTHPRIRFWPEAVMAALSAFLLVMTLLWRGWIEIVFHVDPDAGSGALEWLIVAVCAALTLLLAGAAGYEWRRAQRPAR